MNRLFVLSLFAAGCTCGTFDPSVTRFACTSDEDCGPDFRCAPVQGVKECVSSATSSDSGVDAGIDAGLVDAGVDSDLDGVPLPLDCNDLNPAIYPGAVETCGNGVDDDCDLLTDCAAPSCTGQPCVGGGTCAALTCIAATEVLCNDGLDNDGDGRTDCADPECPVGTSCNDSNGCTLGERCVADAGCEKTSDVVCASPPGACFNAIGVCSPDAGATCVYSPRTGMCDDGLSCTTGDRCNAGVCSGAAISCTNPPPGACWASAGVCGEPAGTCTYAPMAGGACNDGQNCTINDRCDGDGGCAGAAVTCTPPSQCHQATGACNSAGTCLFSPRTGQACDAGTPGTCTAGYACDPTPVNVFPYVPSNFTESQLPMTGGVNLAVTCSSAIDTMSATIISACLSSAIPMSVFTPPGGEPTVLVTVDSFTVSTGMTLNVIGTRPLIIAVKGSAAVLGNITVNNGSGTFSGCGGGGAGVQGSSQGRGGGGGGGFGSLGGAGGTPGLSGQGAGARGPVNGTPDLIPLRGGCSGGSGVGAGGRAGGALQISAAGDLAISGLIHAPGGGGGTARNGSQNGGGGGGSGGAILLEGRTVALITGATLAANGGGGGEAGDGDDGASGNASSIPAAGGSGGGSPTGDGGDGAAALVAAQSGSPGLTTVYGGGGGGGGVGRVRVNASTSCTIANAGVLISPPATSNNANGCP